MNEDNFIKRLSKQYPTLEYVFGYKNSNTPVTLRCKVCGSYFTRTAQCVRGGRKTCCLNCKSKRTKTIKQMKKEQQLCIKDIKRQRFKEINSLYEHFKNTTLYIHNCVICNQEYIEHSVSKYCPQCRKKINDKHSNKSLRKLFNRDKGICYICGNKCDYEDYVYNNNTFIAGNYYPSIDHVIPLAKGGTDDWNNLKLAHRICNSQKKDK